MIDSMVFWIAIAAALGCAICNGIASVLQKVSADKEKKVTSLHARLFIRLLHDLPYIAGLAIDGIAWILTLIAVHYLPLFVVQPITAFSVVVTIMIERVFFRRRLNRSNLLSIGLIILGLLLLAFTATPETAHPVANTTKWLIALAPLVLAAAGSYFVKRREEYATAVLAGLSGLGFGGTAVVGRMLEFDRPYWHLLYNPLFFSIIAYGLIAILLFTVALQRQHASIVNGVMITFETLGPAIIGLLFLGDHPKGDMWIVMVVGAIVAVAGTLLLVGFPPARPVGQADKNYA